MARDEFLYAWVSSDGFFEDLEMIYEMHVPSQTDWDTFLGVFHEYLPGSQENAKKFMKNF